MSNPPKDKRAQDDQELFAQDWLTPPNHEGFPEVDPELESLRPQINWFRPVLMIVVMCFAAYVATKFEEELRYFFSPNEPVDIGDVTDYADRADKDPAWSPNIPHNRLVRLSGLPDHEKTSIACSARPPSRFYKLIGAQLYVQVPLGELSAIACEAERKPGDAWEETPFFDGLVGRAIDFKQTQNPRYEGFKRFYEQTTGQLFCANMTDARREARIDLLRQLLREKHKAQHGDYPSDALLQQQLAKEPLCHDAFLVLGDDRPIDYWPYLAVVIVLGLIVLWNITALALWLRRLLQITRGA
jgi:hypothetical protein